MSDDAAGDEVRERVLREMAAAFPARERPEIVARLLDEIERLHRDNRVPVPGWVERMKVRIGAARGDPSACGCSPTP